MAMVDTATATTRTAASITIMGITGTTTIRIAGTTDRVQQTAKLGPQRLYGPSRRRRTLSQEERGASSRN
jgi:hypothetical protein